MRLTVFFTSAILCQFNSGENPNTNQPPGSPLGPFSPLGSPINQGPSPGQIDGDPGSRGGLIPSDLLPSDASQQPFQIPNQGPGPGPGQLPNLAGPSGAPPFSKLTTSGSKTVSGTVQQTMRSQSTAPAKVNGTQIDQGFEWVYIVNLIFSIIYVFD